MPIARRALEGHGVGATLEVAAMKESAHPSDGAVVVGQLHMWLAAQLDQLTEDLVQVSHAGGIVLDVGWYPDCAAHGEFSVYVVHRDDWDQPFFHQRARTIAALVDLLRAAVLVAEERAAGQ
jgi:hypothetical protein